ncbi:MAG TPA: methyltransferase domain-containing protein [Terracidiphilus sp.]|jgi:ubiquinone/menaquinone biosynthesis C-methylase UbiE/uncharacterized protein YbaR (Trm112 family)
MKKTLLEILRCLNCHSVLLATATGTSFKDEIESGQLVCAQCGQTYPIVQGVPQLMLPEGLEVKTCAGFEYQWNKRHSGRAEGRGVVYGYSVPKFMAWFVNAFTPGLRSLPTGGWLLDAGCGSGEKAAALAQHFPEHQVVAIDQSNSIVHAAFQHATTPNLHFVQANVWSPPFAERSMRLAMSIGVLHHTPSTLKAFRAIAAMVAPGGDLVTWIYPLPEEDTFWAGLYRQRDHHFLGVAHRLPNWMVLLLSRIYVAMFFPLVLRFLKAQYRINKDRFPIYPDRPHLGQLYRSSVFLSFDNLMPKHQFRHGRPEVRQWYAEDGFGHVNDAYPGFFHSTRNPENVG